MLIKRDMVLYFTGKLVPAISTLLLMWLGIRFLGEAEYGKYILQFNIITLITAFTAGWIQQGMLRYNNSGYGTPDIFRNRQFSTMALTSAFISFLLMLIVSFIYFKLTMVSAFIASSLSFLYCYYLVGLSSLQSQFKSSNYAISETLYAFGSIAICTLLLVVLHKTVFESMILAILSGCIISILFGIRPALINEQKETKYDHKITQKFLSFGLPVTIWLFISYLFNIADRFLIEYFFTTQAVGTYSAVYDFIYKISGFLCMPVLLAFHPVITSKWNEGERKTAHQLIRKALIFEVILGGGFMFFAWFGGEFFFEKFIHLHSENLLQLIVPLVLSSMLWQMALLIHKPLELNLATGFMLGGIIMSVLLNMGLNIYLLPRYGFEIAAINTLIATVAYIVYTLCVNQFIGKIKKQ